MKIDLKNCSTKQLVEELKTREGVEDITADPYTDTFLTVNGPAVVLIITD